MSALTLLLCLLCQVLIVAGNLLLKHAMADTNEQQKSRLQTGLWLSAGVVLLGLWFFLWLGLLSKWDLSQLYVFEGLAPILVMVSAWLFLSEKVSPRGWIGVALIGAGLTLVAAG
jgi:drug/metabolite transporter (DMT)-like permease